MTIDVQPYADRHAAEWDRFCAAARSASFLPTRRFLGYHGDRFEDASLLFFKDGRLAGVLPAARAPADRTQIVSHPGATFGGVVHDGALAGAHMLEAFEAMRAHYRGVGATTLVYKAMPHIYQSRPAQDDLYALFRLGAQRTRCDLSCSVDLADRRAPSERRRRGLKKALAAVELSADVRWLPQVHALIADNLARRHGAAPVHSAAELGLLHELFPERVGVRCALVGAEVAAGVVLFNASSAWRAQYIGSNEVGQSLSALDAVFDRLIADAAAAGARWFDFGTSNEDGGRVLNEGLYRFKTEFGGGGVAYEFYTLAL